MRKSVIKFKNFLENKLNRIVSIINNEYLKTCERKLKQNSINFDFNDIKVKDASNPKYIIDLESNKELLEYMINECVKRLNNEIVGLEIFLEFKCLSEFLEISDLQVKEKFNVLQFFILENMKNGIFKSKKTIFDMLELEKCKYKYATFEEVKELIDKSELHKFLDRKIIFNNNLKKKQIEIREYTKKCSRNLDNEINAHRILKFSYFDKEHTYEQSDIDRIISSLRVLKVSDNICEEIKFMLEKNLKTRKEKDKAYIKELQMKNSVDKFKDYLQSSQNYDICEIAKIVMDQYIFKDYQKYVDYNFKKWVTEYILGDKEKYFSKESIEKDFKKVAYFNSYIEPITDEEIKRILRIINERSRLYVSDYFENNVVSSDVEVKINLIESLNNFLNIINSKDVKDNLYSTLNFYQSLSTLLNESSLKPKEKLFVIVRYTEILYYYSFDKKEKKLKRPNLDLDKIRLLYRNLKENILDLENPIEEENIHSIVFTLNELKVSSKIIEEINIYLNSMLSKNINEEEENVKIYNTQQDIKEKEEEKKKLREELQNYFDFNNMKSIRLLSYEEIKKVIEILRKLNVRQETILEVLRINEKELNNADTLTKFKYLIGRLNYYKEKYYLDNEISEIEDYYTEICNAPEEDKEEYIGFIEECLDKVNVYIPKTFEYELENK